MSSLVQLAIRHLYTLQQLALSNQLQDSLLAMLRRHCAEAEIP